MNEGLDLAREIGYCTPRQAAVILGVAKQTITKRIQSGDLTVTHLDKRTALLRIEQVTALAPRLRADAGKKQW